MTGGRCPSVAALTVSAPSGHPLKDPPAFPPLAHPFGRLQAGFLWIALADSAAFLSVNHIPPLPIPHGMEYPLGSRMHLGVVHPRLEAREQPFPRSPRSCSRVNPRVLRPLTRGPQGQPSPLLTPHGRPGVQGILPTSRGQAPYGWPMVHHFMATGFPIPRSCCWALSVSHPIPCSPLPHPVTGPIPASLGFPIPRGCCAAPFHPPSLVYTPAGRQQPCGAGPLDPHPSRDRFVRLARVAPIPPPPLSPVPRPVTHPGLFPASHAFSVSWGRHVALATRPSLSCPLFPASRFFFPTGSAPFPGPVRVPSTGRPLPAPFRLCGGLPSGPVVGPSSWPPRPPVIRAFPSSGHPSLLFLSFLVFFFRATRGLSPVLLLRPVPPPPACFVPHALLGRCGVLFVFLFFFSSPPCILPYGSLLPACTHNNTAQAISHGSLPCSFPVPSQSCGVALGGPRPCHVGAPPSRPTHITHKPPSPLFCLLPALLLLFSCSVCSPLVAPAPWLYLARSHAPQGLCPVLQPVGRLGRTPQIPLRGDSPIVLPRQLPLHQFPDGLAGRPVRLNAGHRHGVSLC